MELAFRLRLQPPRSWCASESLQLRCVRIRSASPVQWTAAGFARPQTFPPWANRKATCSTCKLVLAGRISQCFGPGLTAWCGSLALRNSQRLQKLRTEAEDAYTKHLHVWHAVLNVKYVSCWLCGRTITLEIGTGSQNFSRCPSTHMPWTLPGTSPSLLLCLRLSRPHHLPPLFPLPNLYGSGLHLVVPLLHLKAAVADRDFEIYMIAVNQASERLFVCCFEMNLSRAVAFFGLAPRLDASVRQHMLWRSL
jgi:hypothetical protein